MKTKLIQTLKPTHKISIKQVQSLAILSMNQKEIETMISEIAQENPLLEVHPDFYHFTSDVDLNQIADTHEKTLTDELLEQVSTSKFKNHEALKAIIYHLDSNGYLLVPIAEIKRATHFTIKDLKEALSHVQTFQPFGVGARDLKECITLQCLQIQTKNQDILLRCVHYLEDLSKGHFNKIAKILNTDEKAIKECLNLIKHCNPKPGAMYGQSSTFIYPEIFITEEDGNYIIQTKNLSQYLSINQDLAQINDPDVKKYIQQQIKVLNELFTSLSKRYTTLHTICTVLFQIQKDAILYGLPLKPCTYKQVGELVNRHPSTIFRSIQNKALQIEHKTIYLSSLFTNESKNGLSSDQIKNEIKDMVAKENKTRPYSDEQLVHLLKERDISISRRCITKYREQCRIPNSTRRKITS